MPRIERVCGCAVRVQKTFDEYTISGPEAEALRNDFVDRGFKPGPYQYSDRMFTITENDMVGSYEAVRIKQKLNYLAQESALGA